MKTLLGKRGHRAKFANDGNTALKRATEEAFDVVLLDLHMLEMDGFEVVRAVRARELTTGKHLPIIALTARSRAQAPSRTLGAFSTIAGAVALTFEDAAKREDLESASSSSNNSRPCVTRFSRTLVD